LHSIGVVNVNVNVQDTPGRNISLDGDYRLFPRDTQHASVDFVVVAVQQSLDCEDHVGNVTKSTSLACVGMMSASTPVYCYIRSIVRSQERGCVPTGPRSSQAILPQ